MTGNRDTAPFWIDPDVAEVVFPDVELAMREPDGLLAVGADLSVPTLLLAYRRGIFPWYGPGQPIIWWAPDPRLVLFPLHDKLGAEWLTGDFDPAAIQSGKMSWAFNP